MDANAWTDTNDGNANDRFGDAGSAGSCGSLVRIEDSRISHRPAKSLHVAFTRNESRPYEAHHQCQRRASDLGQDIEDPRMNRLFLSSSMQAMLLVAIGCALRVLA